MLGRFVGPAGEPRGRNAVEAGTVDKAREMGRRTAGVQLGWWFAPERKREGGWLEHRRIGREEGS